jgi:hypothetical protein
MTTGTLIATCKMIIYVCSAHISNFFFFDTNILKLIDMDSEKLFDMKKVLCHHKKINEVC